MTAILSKKIVGSQPMTIKGLFTAFFTTKAKAIVLPTVGIICFLLFWSLTASSIDTSLGKFPGPSSVATQISNLINEHNTEREKRSCILFTPKTKK
ncbi:hypothetical protein KAN5_06730 [Pseudoalteromonas sp. KAN5]|nr:hypothetical protein KAN5_06730 [Pseudoalteromonas sp. KAN5]